MDLFSGSSPHQPLSATDPSEIRVIKLSAGKWEDPISCELVHVSLDARPDYIALSYTWGDPTVTKEINVNGMTYPVTTNLFLALKRLRQRAFRIGDPLWIDALCIKQQDKAERAAQVQRMTDIFRYASLVLIYVGEIEEHERDDVHHLFKRAKEAAAACRYDVSTFMYYHWSAKKEYVKELRTEDDMKTDLALYRFSQRPWFSRVWVIQELAFQIRHAGIICGDLAVDLKHLLLLEDIYKVASEGPQMFRNGLPSGAQMMTTVAVRVTLAASVSTLRARLTPADNLVWLLHLTGSFKATEERDKLYALLGLCTTGSVPTSLIPSYDCSIQSVYQSYTRYLIEHTGYFSILIASRYRAFGIPSWVVDLKVDGTRTAPLAHPSNVSISTTGYIMNAQGFRHGRRVQEIRLTRVKLNTEDMIGPLTNQLRRLEHLIFRKALALREPTPRDVVITPFLERCQKWGGHKVEEIVETYNFLIDFSTAEHQEGQHVPNLEPLTLDSLAVLTWFNYIVFDSGKVGSFDNLNTKGPVTRKGDIVCLLKGSRASLVLRENIESDTYELIRSCSVPEVDEEYYVEESAWSEVPLEIFAIA